MPNLCIPNVNDRSKVIIANDIVVTGSAVGDLTKTLSPALTSKKRPNWFMQKINRNKTKAYKERCLRASESLTLSLTIPSVKSSRYSITFCFLLGFISTFCESQMQTNRTTAAIKVEPIIPERSKFKPKNLKTNGLSITS